MTRTRVEVPQLENMVVTGKKKFVRYAEGAQLYSLGLHTFQEIGECKIVCVKSNCADLFYAPYWGKQLKGWISNGKT